MAKIVQDVIGGERRTIRKIPLPGKRQAEKEEAPSGPMAEENVFRYVSERNAAVDYTHSRPKKGWRWLWLLVVAAVVLLGFAIGSFFSGAKLSITPKSVKIPVDLELKAVGSAQTGNLHFKVLALEKTGQTTAKAQGEKLVQERASGTIIVYNNFSTSPQRLIRNTRFQTPEGLIYRISDPIVIPGRTTKNGATVPGSIETLVVADTAGADYNIGLSDFTLPALKGDTARYQGFYARSKTPMTGGSSGMVKQVTAEDLAASQRIIENQLESDLALQAKSSTPKEQVFFPRAYQISFTPLANQAEGEDSVVISENAKLSALLFDREELAAVLAKEVLDNYDGAPVMIPNLENLIFDLRSSAISKTLDNSGQITFNLKGTATFVWQYDENKLKTELSGKLKSDLAQILMNYPAIEKAEVTVRPFWKNHFPDDVGEITFESVLSN